MDELVLDEQQEAMLMESVLVENLGFISMDSYNRFKAEAVMGMMRFGDDFLHGIGIALKFADHKDAVKLIEVWRNEISQHQLLEQIYQAQQQAKKESKSDILITG